MPRGYNLNPDLQRKIEDERAGRLDFVYETALSVEDAIKRVGRTVPTKLASYDFKRENGVLYIIFTDNSVPNDGLHYIKPMKYALRFESEGESTIIRVRYIWEDGPGNDQYLFPGDVDDFFCKLFDAKVSDLPKKIWINGTNARIAADPLKIHGSKNFWVIAAIFLIIWLVGMVFSLSGCGKASEPGITEEINVEDTEDTESVAESSYALPEFTEANLAELYENIQEVADHEEFSGKWTRTNVHSSHSADITIEKEDSGGFEFSGTFFYYYHMGDVAGKAYFVSPTEAVYKQLEDDYDFDGEPAYIGFSLDDDGLHVITDGFVEGLGANVYVEGDYVQDEPYYTNANVIEENFSEQDLEQLKELLKEESYNDIFLTNTEIGGVTSEEVVLTDKTAAKHIECFVPTAGDGYNLLITEDGRYYFYHPNSSLFVTNDNGYTDMRLPDYTVASAAGEQSDEASPLAIWEFEGYVDECSGYLWKDEFINCDYDGDGLNDRLSRKWDGAEQIAIYTIEFGNGDVLTVPKGWETGFPHVQSADLDGDGAKEILVTLSYDTSTYPYSFGDLWLFDRDSAGNYAEVSLPLASGENGAKGFTVDYEAPANNEIKYTLKEAGMSASVEIDDDFLNSYWTNEAFSELRPIFWAEMKEGASPAIRCYVNPVARTAPFLGFNLSYRSGRYEIGYIEIDEPEDCNF